MSMRFGDFPCQSRDMTGTRTCSGPFGKARQAGASSRRFKPSRCNLHGIDGLENRGGRVEFDRRDEHGVGPGGDRIGARERASTVGAIVGRGDRATDRILPRGSVRDARRGSRGRVLQRSRLRIGCVVIPLPPRGLNDLAGAIVDCLSLFQDHVVADRERVGIRRLIEVIADIGHGRPAQSVVGRLGEQLRPGRERLDQIPRRIEPRVAGQRTDNG